MNYMKKKQLINSILSKMLNKKLQLGATLGASKNFENKK